MSKKQKIVIMTTVSVCAIILIIAGIYTFKKISINNENKRLLDKQTKIVSVTVEKALFGSRVRVHLTPEGKKKYPTAKKYQMFDETPISALVDITSPTTVMPIQNPGNRLVLKLYTDKKSEIASINVVLEKNE